MKRYNLINNSLGWLCFLIAGVTYMLTLEPTASFWDCPEFISQGYKLEVGHPPGNPIFMLAARFFVNFAGGDVTKVAYAVNSMSALLSALTILLLFWTITHLVRKLVVKTGREELSLAQMLTVFGSGLCGALMYTWSDTFWFSAVEGEVYAFSSFCTALVFWLILKWENRADRPHSDRYLVLIAYVIGISIAVHLLNLLCIPAIVLVIYYRKFAEPTAKGSLVALLVSFVIVALILYGLVPGFVEVAQWFELYFVNTVGLSYNMGVLIYAVLLVAVFVWGVWELNRQRNPLMIKLSFALAVLLSGIPFAGDSWVTPVVIMGALLAYLLMARRVHVRYLMVALLSIFVIFIGYSSYALLLIRSSANPPMNQNEPDNVFSLSSYLSREQYGETPLFYGRTPESSTLYRMKGMSYEPVINTGKAKYAKAVKVEAGQPDRYQLTGYDEKAELTPELNMLFPRIYSGQFINSYKGWIGLADEEPLGRPVEATILVDENGEPFRTETRHKPTMAQSIQYFLTYQLNHMYWRYFMWNFAGRQNDIQGNGEVNHGNWISGIPFIDNPRLGDQSLLPAAEGRDNKGHNVFYMLPLLMGILGIIWQSFLSKKGIEQFWVVFFLFFMTGIAIVLYLNQTPGQPRERDYAFAGSFYAYAIWVGLGVAAIAHWLTRLKLNANLSAAIAAVVGLLVPLQVVSQTWDDHDRSGRYTARDFGFNYLNSLDPDAIIFTNGDNDTFPLWYAQEVEGVRTDVKVVNLSYLTTDWYVNQVTHPSYDAKPIEILARPVDYAYDRLQISYLDGDSTRMNALSALEMLYGSQVDPRVGVCRFPTGNMYIPANLDSAVKSGRITAGERDRAVDTINVNILNDTYIRSMGGPTLSNTISLDIIASSIARGWDRPIYFASTVPEDYYLNLSPYMRSTGMAYEVSPLLSADGRTTGVNTDKMYRNVTERFRWGGLENVKEAKDIYLDETVRRMVSSTRLQLLDLALALYSEGMASREEGDTTRAKERLTKAVEVLELMNRKLPVVAAPYSVPFGCEVGALYVSLGDATGNKALNRKGLDILEAEIARIAEHVVYYQSLKPWQYSTLQNTDLYIYRRYMLDLMQNYLDAGGDSQKLMAIPGMERINFQQMQGYAN